MSVPPTRIHEPTSRRPTPVARATATRHGGRDSRRPRARRGSNSTVATRRQRARDGSCRATCPAALSDGPDTAIGKTASTASAVHDPHASRTRTILLRPRRRLGPVPVPPHSDRDRPPNWLLSLLSLSLFLRSSTCSPSPLPPAPPPANSSITPGLPCPVFLAGRGRGVRREAVDPPSSKAQA